MKRLVRFYRGFCKAEELAVALCIAAIAFLVFLSALLRLPLINRPLNWAVDMSLLLFAWVVFLGADTALRRADFVRVDMLVRLFPLRLQKILYYGFYILAVAFLVVLIRYGLPLCVSNRKRLFQTLGISYSWATMSAPVGSFLLIITIVLKLIKHRKDAVVGSQGREAI
ncbi:MAG: TRAP transporter small permease subunit [Spirochaetaceae bacterium]|jgi:TRAP-type C4-dicarboxylate transport system permease small subunit|nr:TRAP transporter small permease subunit [Spirochaetaceae bacterium]